MAETPTPPKAKIKGLGTKLKGLPPWAYVLAVGVGGGAIYVGMKRSRAEADAEYITGDYNTALAPMTAGEAYPVGSQGAGYYFDPTTGGTTPGLTLTDFADFLGVIMPMVGGGSQPSAGPPDHYQPPQITVNVPPQATPTPQQQPSQSPAPSASPAPAPCGGRCKGEYNFCQDSGPRTGICYKVVLKYGKRYRYYENGDKIPA